MTHLRLVPPPGTAPAPARRRNIGPSPLLSLTPDEVRGLRASIRGLVKTRYGTVVALSRALGVVPGVLTRRKRPGPGLAIALWRMTGIPVESLLRPTLAALPVPPVTSGEPAA